MQLAFSNRPNRRSSLTPMIDVVFLLLVFFMLASRFGLDSALTFPLASGGGKYTGPPRLIEVAPYAIRLNGIEVVDLVTAVKPFTQEPSDTLILRGEENTNLQRIVEITETLWAAGFTSIVLIE